MFQTVIDNKTGKTADKTLPCTDGNKREFWVIKGYPRYYLARYNNLWSVYDRDKERPLKKTYHPNGWVYRMIDPKGAIRQEFEHRLIMQCLSPNVDAHFVRHRDGNVYKNDFENLYWWFGRACYVIRNRETGMVYRGSVQEIRKAAKIGTERVQDCIAGSYVKNWEFIGKEDTREP